MTQLLLCNHYYGPGAEDGLGWLDLRQDEFRKDEQYLHEGKISIWGEKIRKQRFRCCEVCRRPHFEGDPEPRVVLGRLEVEGAGIDAGVCDDCRRLWESEPDNENIKICVHPKCFGALVGR
jgi:hypothetical protein